MSIRSVAKAAFWSKDRTSGKISIEMSGVSPGDGDYFDHIMGCDTIKTGVSLLFYKPNFIFYCLNR
ncbi:MAG: hypothetical protein REI95_10620 [Oxalicibacterium faecigallinarum]|uniref:hypothetical protein n=1 Tax=Oxalicibacterium faecigallinarum TaxID=573741 RepID=UPI002807AFEB|nr:hypothetical protein [Oxalicibacterium faecigallinarum]MDQ7970086.1 hypothetical protein [Oxalicibacterium faecigallinarum]